MIRRAIIVGLIFIASPATAELLPGFSLDLVATPEGFLTSIDFDANGVLHYTTMDGGIFRLDQGEHVEVARVDTAVEGNAVLLGMAFAPDETIVVHYVSPDLVADIVSRIDLDTKVETILGRFECSPDGEPCSSEHHGGNPEVDADGNIYVGIGDYGFSYIALRDDLWASRIMKIHVDGTIERFARGFRNPYDLQWDPVGERIIASDNGPVGNDEVVFVHEGDHHGWPLTMGNLPPVEGTAPPVYTFPGTTAPTGLVIANGASGWFREGLLVTGFVTRSLYYFPEVGEDTISPPIVILDRETTELIDVRQNHDGEVFIGSAFGIYQLVQPEPGDANGDGVVSRSDRDALLAELAESAGMNVSRVQEGMVQSSWGVDADQNGVVDMRDLAELSRILSGRDRAIRHPASSNSSNRRRTARGASGD